MQNEFLSLTELGLMYGGTSHKVGKWLTGLGLRVEKGKPSQRAFNEGFVAKRESTQPGTYFYVWNAVQTTALLDRMGYRRQSDAATK